MYVWVLGCVCVYSLTKSQTSFIFKYKVFKGITSFFRRQVTNSDSFYYNQKYQYQNTKADAMLMLHLNKYHFYHL